MFSKMTRIELAVFDVTGRHFNLIKLHSQYVLNHFYINKTKFNYNLEFEDLTNEANNWKQTCSLIDYCDNIGVTIPHYCYQKGLSVAGNCRMCLVEIPGATKPVVSCAMSAKTSLKAGHVYTNSPLVRKVRENILEFLLINHPLDCPICDQGGECDLQDQSLFYGITKKRFYNYKRIVMDKNVGPIIKTIMTRCIHCTRCVRFAKEIAGVYDLGLFGRGYRSEIGTFVSKMFSSELSGNIADICPVGALTSKFYPYTSRTWELKIIDSIDYSDSFGTDLLMHLKNNKIIKVLPAINKILKENIWINDKTRFSFTGMYPITKPLSLTELNGNKFELKWSNIFEEILSCIYIQDHLNNHIKTKKKTIILIDESIDIETLSLLAFLEKKFSFFELRLNKEGIMGNNDLESNYLLNLKEPDILDNSTACILINTNPRYENTYLNLKIRKRFLKGYFEIFSSNPSTNTTYKTTPFSNAVKILLKLFEGNSIACQKLVNSRNPIIIISSNNFRRRDNMFFIQKIIEKLNSSTKLNFKLAIQNKRLNESGIQDLFSIKTLKRVEQLQNNFFFINPDFEETLYSKLIYYKLFNKRIVTTDYTKNNFIFEHSVYNSTENPKCLFNSTNYYKTPNKFFYETAGTYLNTEGDFKRTNKIIYQKTLAKTVWQFIRKLHNNLKNLNYLYSYEINNNLTVETNNNNLKFKKFLTQNYFPVTDFDLSEQNFLINKNDTIINNCVLSKKEKSKFFCVIKKVSLTSFKPWLNDFYIGGKDLYTNKSALMLKCSKSSRLSSTNFVL